MAKKKHTDKAVALGHGVFAVFQKGVPKRIEFRSLPTLRARLGDAQLAGFVQAMNAAERLGGFVQLLSLNRQQAKESRLAADRNHRLLVFLIFGTLYEAMLALDALNGAGIKARVGRDNEAWLTLNEMRKRWDKNPMLGIFRHKFAHHLGDHDDVIRGLDRLRNRHVVMFATDGEGTILDSTYPFAFEVILQGTVPDGERFMEAASRAVDDHRAFSRSIQELFGEALRAVGVRFDEAP